MGWSLSWFACSWALLRARIIIIISVFDFCISLPKRGQAEESTNLAPQPTQAARAVGNAHSALALGESPCVSGVLEIIAQPWLVGI